MEFKRLDTEREKLVAHMRAVGYSGRYVKGMELTLRRLLADAPKLDGVKFNVLVTRFTNSTQPDWLA